MNICDELNISREALQNLHETISESFHFLISQLKEQPLNMEGAVFVCNEYGELIEGNHFSKSNVEDEIKFLIKKGVSWQQSNLGPNAINACMRSLTYEYVRKQDHDFPFLQQFNSMSVPIFFNSHQMTAILGMIIREDSLNPDPLFFLRSIAIAFKAILSMNVDCEMNRTKKRDDLYQVAKNLHSKIDVDSVLFEVFHTIKVNYPEIELELYLSHDNHTISIPFKLLSVDEKDDLCNRAFMDGKMFCGFNQNGASIISAPLAGKQGVYGVLKLQFQHSLLDNHDVKYISMLVESAGIAFENAKLNEQSNVLINELRLINTITSRLNQSLKLQDIFDFALKELIKIFSANYVCILQLNSLKTKMIVQASNLPSFSNEVFDMDYGFSGMVYRTKEPIIISDYLEDAVVDSRFMELTQSRSIIASPILVGSEVVGVILVTHYKPRFFSYENFKLLIALSGHIGLAISNAALHAEVQRMVMTDNLTGLYARGYLDEQVSLMQKKDFCGSLIIVDIDYFKKVNDTYGHQAGDKLLIQISQIIMTSIRKSDIAARWGGEEIAIYLPQATMDETLHAAERIRTRIYKETEPQVSVSCGIARWNSEDQKISAETLFYRADMALYKAKNSGRNQMEMG